MQCEILKLDPSGRPIGWLRIKDAVSDLTNGKVLWSAGAEIVLRGGHDRSGQQSLLMLPTILAVRGRVHAWQERVPFTARALFMRDRNTCAYCGLTFADEHLTIEHIVPQAQGGRTTYLNTVAACARCNQVKRDRTPEQAGMPLLFVPYEPNAYEGFILRGRNVLADQRDFLSLHLPKHSRLLM